MRRLERTHTLAAQLFELLDDEQRAQVEQQLASDPGARATLSAMRRAVREAAGQGGEHPSELEIRAAVAGRQATREGRGDLEHLIGCRECGFLASVVLAEQEDDRPLADRQPGRADAGWRWRTAAFAGRAWVPAAVLGGVALTAVTLRLVLSDRPRQDRDRPADGVPGALHDGAAPALWSRPVRLGASRGSDAPPKVLLYELIEPNLTLLFRLPSPTQGARWRLSTDGATVLAGTLPDALPGAAEPEFALTVPVDQLPGPGLFLLELTDPGGSALGRWTFALAVE